VAHFQNSKPVSVYMFICLVANCDNLLLNVSDVALPVLDLRLCIVICHLLMVTLSAF